MKTALNTIIMDGMDVVECIRREALTKNTVRRPLEDITQIDWQNTAELYILGRETNMDAPAFPSSWPGHQGKHPVCVTWAVPQQ